jgi:hypothetical protein
VKGAVNDLGNVTRRPQTIQEDRRGGGAYRYTHGRSERPGVCGARFRRHAEYAGCALRAAASGSTHRFTTAATTSTTAGQPPVNQQQPEDFWPYAGTGSF